MVHRIITLLSCILLLSLLILVGGLLTPPAYAVVIDPKPMLTLNLQQGPLGVTLTLQGKNFHPGHADFSYTDSQGLHGMFMPPSDTGVLVQADGTFTSTNLIMPSSGVTGSWKILVTDSSGIPVPIRYLVIAAPGQVAGPPSITLNPTTGMSGQAITFTGGNWLPPGTLVKLTLLAGTSSPLVVDPPPVSNFGGMITGTFHLPMNLTVSQATVNATDAATGDLRAQAPITITGITPTPTVSVSPSPTASPTAVASPTPTSMPSPTPSPTVVPTPTSASTASPPPPASGGSNNSGGLLGGLDKSTLGLVLLIVGGALGVAGLMLILFMLPLGERRQNRPPGRQY